MSTIIVCVSGCERSDAPRASAQEVGERTQPAADEVPSIPAPIEAAPTQLDVGGAGASAHDTTGAAEPEAGETTSDTTPAPAAVTPESLLKSVRSTKTSDADALAALGTAETAGAKARKLAEAANARGEALHRTPERAAKFFEWAAEKDPKFADPVFNLAKQAVVQGEVDEVKKHLAQVHARGGKKLLAQIEFDPMWEIVKDDPEVRALLP